jgi:hypothetical protein
VSINVLLNRVESQERNPFNHVRHEDFDQWNLVIFGCIGVIIMKEEVTLGTLFCCRYKVDDHGKKLEPIEEVLIEV